MDQVTYANQFAALDIVQRPPWIGRMARIVAAGLCALPILVAFVPWQQNFRCAGRVVALAPLDRRQSVEAPIAGRVVRWYVREGSVVRSGDPLVEISDIDPDLVERLNREKDALQGKYEASRDKVGAYEQQVANLEATRDLAVAAGSFRVDMAGEKVRAATAALESAQAALKAARAQLSRHENLLADGLVSRRDYDVAERDFEMTRNALEGAEASLTSSANEKQAVEAELDRIRAEAESKIDSARATLNDARGQVQDAKAKLVKLEVSISRQQSQQVCAPRDGIVFRLTVNQDGEIVKAGDCLMVLVPQTEDRSVELWMDGNDAPLVREGSHVRIQFEGWPAVQFVGWPSVAVGTFGGTVALIDSTDNGKGQFRILVVPATDDEPWPDARYLRQGVRAKGWVLLNRVSLGYEAWRQLNGFPPVIAADEPSADAGKDGTGQ